MSDDMVRSARASRCLPPTGETGGGADWRGIESAPISGQVWVIGGRYDVPKIIEADGEWWRSPHSPKSAVPAYWMPVVVPSAPAGFAPEARANPGDHLSAEGREAGCEATARPTEPNSSGDA